MKVLKWLLGLAFALTVLLVGGGLMLPSTSHMQRSIEIRRAPAEVYATLASFQRFNEWSPWFPMDPAASYTYAGPVSGVGAKMAWVGNSAVGSGGQAITAVTTDSKIVVALDFGGSQATASYVLVTSDAGTRVTWMLDSSHGYNPVNHLFGAFLLDGMVGKDFETGLARLTAVLENESG